MYLRNSFSLNMLENLTSTITVTEITRDQAHCLLTSFVDPYSGEFSPILPWHNGEEPVFDGQSAIGHADTAAVVSTLLGVEIPCNRITVTLKKGDKAIVAQYYGPRLPEGATTLPEGAEIKWVEIVIS